MATLNSIWHLGAVVCFVIFITGCTTSAYKFEDESNIYKCVERPFKIYIVTSESLAKENPKAYSSDVGTKPEIRKNLTQTYPDLFCDTEPSKALQVQVCTRYFGKTQSGGGMKFLSFITLGLIPYSCETKFIHKMDFILPDGTILQHPFYKIYRERGSLGLLGVFQLHRLLPELKNSVKGNPYADPVFLRIHANGVSRFSQKLLLKNFQDSSKEEAVELLTE